MATEVPEHRCNHRERLALASEVSARVSWRDDRCVVPKINGTGQRPSLQRKTPAETRSAGASEFYFESTNRALGLGRSRGGGRLFFVVGQRLLERDLAN